MRLLLSPPPPTLAPGLSIVLFPAARNPHRSLSQHSVGSAEPASSQTQLLVQRRVTHTPLLLPAASPLRMVLSGAVVLVSTQALALDTHTRREMTPVPLSGVGGCPRVFTMTAVPHPTMCPVPFTGMRWPVSTVNSHGRLPRGEQGPPHPEDFLPP